jgi:hypothetical protein
MRDLGVPVVPPVSKTKTGRPAIPFGTQRWTGPPRSHSSWKGPSCRKSEKLLIRSRGSQPRREA